MSWICLLRLVRLVVQSMLVSDGREIQGLSGDGGAELKGDGDTDGFGEDTTSSSSNWAAFRMAVARLNSAKGLITSTSSQGEKARPDRV